MTEKQKRNRAREPRIELYCLDVENTVIAHYKKYPRAIPDGSFVRAAWWRGYDNGKRSARKGRAQ